MGILRAKQRRIDYHAILAAFNKNQSELGELGEIINMDVFRSY